MKACHGVGKTFTLAVAALWWLARYPEGIVLTTSPTQRQVRTQLWSEIHRLVERAKVPYPNLKTTELKFRDENNFAIGFSTNQAENFQGYPRQIRPDHRRRGAGDHVRNLGCGCRNHGWRNGSYRDGRQSDHSLRRIL